MFRLRTLCAIVHTHIQTPRRNNIGNLHHWLVMKNIANSIFIRVINVKALYLRACKRVHAY